MSILGTQNTQILQNNNFYFCMYCHPELVEESFSTKTRCFTNVQHEQSLYNIKSVCSVY